MSKTVITADSPIDFTHSQAERFGIKIIPLHITLDGKEYLDRVNIETEDMFRVYAEKKILPQSSAVSVAEYADFFGSIADEDTQIVHLSLSSNLSSTHQNALIAAKEIPGVFVLDTLHLSSSIALLAVKGAAMRDSGAGAEEIYTALSDMRGKVHTSFVLDTLAFMSKGGRCSPVTAFGANILGIRPMLEMTDGKLGIAKKYRGKIDAVQLTYVEQALERYDNIDKSLAVVCHCGTSPEQVGKLIKLAKKTGGFREVMEMQAGCTIATHCGPNTMGILFMTE